MAHDTSAGPDWARWLDSMEGVPEWPNPTESPAESAGRASWRQASHRAFGGLGTIAPGSRAFW